MQNNKTIKLIFSSLVFCGILISTAYATTQQGRDIVNQLRDDGWSDKEIRTVMENLGYDANDYLGRNLTSKGQELYEQLKDQGRKKERIEQTMESLGYYTNSGIDSIETISSYTSRSCKVYNIEYISNLGVYTSSDLKNKEYFINTDYLKRYIDSKNTQKYSCPNNKGRINNFYNDTSSRTDRYIAPNGKVYFIINQNGSYTSNELATTKNFGTINELKNYIRDHNSLVWMGKYQTNHLNEIYQTITHGSATKEEDQKLDNSDEAKRIRDITRKTELSQIQTAIINSQNDKGEWPQNSIAKSGMKISGITTELLTAGMTAVPTDPDNSNIVDGLGNTKGIGEYIYLVTNRNGVKDAGFALMAKTETADASNWITCDGEKNLDNGYITSSNDLNEIQLCTSLIKSNSCYRDNQGRVNSQKCYYSDENQLRYLVVY